jgi:hypothetical protein
MKSAAPSHPRWYYRTKYSSRCPRLCGTVHNIEGAASQPENQELGWCQAGSIHCASYADVRSHPSKPPATDCRTRAPQTGLAGAELIERERESRECPGECGRCGEFHSEIKHLRRSVLLPRLSPATPCQVQTARNAQWKTPSGSEKAHPKASVLVTPVPWNLGARNIAESPVPCITTNITL